MAKLNRNFMKGASTGIELAVPVLVCAYIGYKIDEWGKTAPLWLFIGIVTGTAAGIWNVWKYLNT